MLLYCIVRTLSKAHSRAGKFRKAGENLYRYSSNGIYYAILRDKGKIKWKYDARRTALHYPGTKVSCDFTDTLQLFAGLLDGVVAQLVERLVRNEKVAGSIPVGSTISAFRTQPRFRNPIKCS